MDAVDDAGHSTCGQNVVELASLLELWVNGNGKPSAGNGKNGSGQLLLAVAELLCPS